MKARVAELRFCRCSKNTDEAKPGKRRATQVDRAAWRRQSKELERASEADGSTLGLVYSDGLGHRERPCGSPLARLRVGTPGGHARARIRRNGLLASAIDSMPSRRIVSIVRWWQGFLEDTHSQSTAHQERSFGRHPGKQRSQTVRRLGNTQHSVGRFREQRSFGSVEK